MEAGRITHVQWVSHVGYIPTQLRRIQRNPASMKNAIFYLGLALLFTHELDAMPNHEWRLLPILNSLSDEAGEAAFLLAHVPLFAVVIAYVASLNSKVRTRARNVLCGFLAIHAVLHFALSAHADYEFASMVSSFLIYGAGLSGVAYLLLQRLDTKSTNVG